MNTLKNENRELAYKLYKLSFKKNDFLMERVKTITKNFSNLNEDKKALNFTKFNEIENFSFKNLSKKKNYSKKKRKNFRGRSTLEGYKEDHMLVQYLKVKEENEDKSDLVSFSIPHKNGVSLRGKIVKNTSIVELKNKFAPLSYNQIVKANLKILKKNLKNKEIKHNNPKPYDWSIGNFIH